MADLKISQLSIATIAPALAYIPIAASGANWAIPATAAAIGAAPTANGVTNGDSHDHSGGDGGTIAYSTLSGLPTLGTAADNDTGTSGNKIPFLDGANTWSQLQVFSNGTIYLEADATTNVGHFSYRDGVAHCVSTNYASRGTKSSKTAISNGDDIFQFQAYCWDGAAWRGGGTITIYTDGAVSSGVVPIGIKFYTQTTATPIERMRIDNKGNVIVNTAAIATNATDGFLYIPNCAGTPTGVPTSYTGRSPMVYDSTNNKLYIYNGAWKSVTLA